MARRIQPIFDSVLADARITGSERSFVESLQAPYQKRKSLSAGRRRCLLQIEERLKAAPEPIDSAMESRLDSVLSRATEAGDRWAMEFIPSLKGQLSAGRSLSARQLEILAKVETRHSDEARAVRDNWGSSFTSEMREKMVIAARYYLANPPTSTTSRRRLSKMTHLSLRSVLIARWLRTSTRPRSSRALFRNPSSRPVLTLRHGLEPLGSCPATERQWS